MERISPTGVGTYRFRRVLAVADVFLIGAALIAVPAAPGAAQTDLSSSPSIVQAAPTSDSSRVSITKSDSVDPVASGAELTYTITVVNTGGAKVGSLILTDQVNHLAGIGVPPQLVLTSTKGGCTQSFLQSHYLVSCSANSLAGRESWTVTIRGVVTAPEGTTINNTASVTATKTAQNFTATATATTLVSTTPSSPLPDLTINKAGPSSVSLLSPLLYTLTVNNIGAANATDIVVVDTLPAGVDLVSASGNSLFVCTPAGPTVSPVTVTCIGGRVNAGSNATISINATSPAAAGTIANTTVVDPDNTIAESNELNNTSAVLATTVTSAPPAPQLDISKTDSPDPVTPGGILTYTVVVTNTGMGPQSRADDVTVVDGTQGLDAASIVASALVNGTTPGICIVEAPQVTCQPPDPGHRLDGLQTMTVTITGMVVASAGTSLINTATVTGNIKNQGVSNTATAITEVKPGIDLTITKGDDPDPVCARSWPDPGGASDLEVCEGGLTYTFIVGNSGINTATGVLVRDPLPEGLVFDSFVAPDFAGGCSVDAANVLTCTGGTILPESTSTITIVLVAPPTTGSISNTVTVDPNNAIFEADETNNTFTITTQVKTGIDLTIFKFDEPGDGDPDGGGPAGTYAPVADGCDPIATSGTQVYTIVVDNFGTQDATDIRMRDFLPADTIFLSVQADNGFQCTYVASGHYVECVQGAILGTASEFYDLPGPAPLGADDARITIKLFAQPTVTPEMHNEAKVDPLHEIAEADESNNIDFENTVVETGDADECAFHQLKITKTQTSPVPPTAVAQNGTLTYNLHVENAGTDPVSNIVVKDFLPTGSRFIEAKDTDTGANIADAFFCVHDGSPLGGVITCTGGALSGTVNTIPDSPSASAIPTARDITVKVFAPDTPGTYPNLSKVDPDNEVAEGNEFDNASQVDTTVTVGGANMFNDLTVDKTDNIGEDPGDHATPGGTIIYTLEVGNAGTDPAFNVTVRDILPAGTTFVSAVDTVLGAGAFTCSEAGGVVECINGTINAASSRFIEITVLAPADIESFASDKGDISVDIVNQAKVDPDNTIPEGNETNNNDNETTKVRSDINLTISKDGPDATSQGQEEEYVLTVTNDGDAPAFEVRVVDALPIGLIPLNVTTGDGNNFNCQVLQDPINFVDCVGDLNAGQEVTITIEIFMTLESGSFDNEACVDPDDEIEESNEIDNCETKTTVVAPGATAENEAANPGSCTDGIDNDLDGLTDGDDPGCALPRPNLSVHKSADSAIVTPGQDLTYTINVSNVGGGDAPGPVTIEDTLPSEVTYVNASATNGFTCAEAAGVVTCTDPGGGLSAGTNTVVTIQVTVNAGVTLPFTNTVEADTAEDGAGVGSCADGVDNGGGDGVDDADADCDSNLANNSDDLTTFVGAADVELVLAAFADLPDPVNEGQTLEYTVVAVNAGTADANGVEVFIEDVVPAGALMTFVGAAGSEGFQCTPLPDPPPPTPVDVTCTGNLAAGAFTIITIAVIPEAGAPPALTSTATVDPSDAFPETDETNNSLTADTTVTGSICTTCIDLVMGSMLDTPDPVAPGGLLTYVITAGNAGDTSSITAGPGTVLIRATLDADLTFVSATAEFDADGANDCALNGPLSGTLGQDVVECRGDLDAGAGVVITIEATVGATETGGGSCADDVDNDGDTFVDGDDPDCQLLTSAEIDPVPAAVFSETTAFFASCTDGIDNDLDGFIDGADAGCATGILTEDGFGVGSCSDGVDNGLDGVMDGADPDCTGAETFPEGPAPPDEFTNANNGPVSEDTVVDVP